jgi:hypothetical protein
MRSAVLEVGAYGLVHTVTSLKPSREFHRSRCGTSLPSIGYDERRACRGTSFYVEPETEEVIHCLTELSTAGSPEAAKLIAA